MSAARGKKNKAWLHKITVDLTRDTTICYSIGGIPLNYLGDRINPHSQDHQGADPESNVIKTRRSEANR